jgi:putative YhdH/YhfP family quinone oxidoreductase
MSLYRAYQVEEIGENAFLGSVKTLDTNALPAGEVLVRVHYSSLNYKDALSATGNRGVTRQYPHTPGIDAAGVVEHSENENFTAGEQVIVTGYDLGMNTAGGFGQYIRVPAKWVVKLPENLTLKEAMIYGTAGFTAGGLISRMSELVQPADGQIVVSGATGGVGSMAVAILTKMGYSVAAISGKAHEHDFLRQLGAKEIIAREDFLNLDKKPILSARYAGAIDTVGGVILENMLKTLQPLGAVATCGSVAGANLNVSVFPFILRGITLIGISSQNSPMKLRLPIWKKLAQQWKPDFLNEMYTEVSVNQLDENIKLILDGKIKGRVVVKMNNE